MKCITKSMFLGFFLLVITPSKISKARIIVIHTIIYRKDCFSFEKMSSFGPSVFSIQASDELIGLNKLSIIFFTSFSSTDFF